MFRFSKRSIERLKGVHPELILVLSRVLERSPYDIGVTHGVRTEKEQAELVEQGKSRTMQSRHLTGDAIDICIYDESGRVTWEWDYYVDAADLFKAAAVELGFEIVCGVDWKDFPDGCHIERGL